MISDWWLGNSGDWWLGNDGDQRLVVGKLVIGCWETTVISDWFLGNSGNG